MHCEEYRHIRTWHIYNTGKMLFIVIEACCKAFTTIGNNQEIMQNNVEAQHKHMYSLYIGSLCNKALSMARFPAL